MHSAGAVTPPHSIFHVWKRLLPRDFSLIFTFTFTGWCSAPAPQHFSLIFTFTFTFTAVHWSIGPEILQYNSSHHELNVDGSRISGSTAGSRLQVEREKFEGRFEQILGRRRCKEFFSRAGLEHHKKPIPPPKNISVSFATKLSQIK